MKGFASLLDALVNRIIVLYIYYFFNLYLYFYYYFLFIRKLSVKIEVIFCHLGQNFFKIEEHFSGKYIVFVNPYQLDRYV